MQTADPPCVSYHDFTSYLKIELNSTNVTTSPNTFERHYFDLNRAPVNRYIYYNKEFINNEEAMKNYINNQVPVVTSYPHPPHTPSECNPPQNFQQTMTDNPAPRKPELKQENDKDLRTFICEICSKGFKSRQQLTTHNVTHTNLKRFSCSECTKCFKLKAQLNTHMKVHSDVKPFACDQCEKRFKLKQQLFNHFKSHSDERPFRCTLCEKAFKFKQQLQIHSRVHDDLRPFQCELCQKSFKLKQQLQSHRKVHSDEKPFQCNRCLKGFKFKQQLQTHYKSHFKDVKDKDNALGGNNDKEEKPSNWEWSNMSIPNNNGLM